MLPLPCPDSILDTVSCAFDLDTFLTNGLRQAVSEMASSEGSVFLFDGSTETLQLRTQTEGGHGAFHLGKGEGIAGNGLQRGYWHIYCDEELKRYFVEWGARHKAVNLRAIVTVPVFYDGYPRAVFCFGFRALESGADPRGLFPAEQSRVEAVVRKLTDPRFANALNRMIVNQVRFDIRTSCNNTARLRQVVAEYLNQVLDAFPKAGKRRPDLAYLQLVDRRRGTIRTVQGDGMPLNFQLSLSHSLDSRDVQAYVVRHRRPLIVVGRDQRFNPLIFDRFGHHQYVRLWIPLFPFPESQLVHRPGRSMEAVLADALEWRAPEAPDALARRLTADWRREVMPTPPERLVYGTLELGYIRDDMEHLSFQPLEKDHAAWCMARAYAFSEPLFRATLPGALDSIAKAVAHLAWPSTSRLTVAMPNWSSPEVRSFPAASFWPATEPTTTASLSPPPELPARFEIDEETLSREHRDMLRRVAATAEDAIRVSLRLDDHAADLYTLLEDADSTSFVGTEYPDPKMNEILQEICREAAAETCILAFYEKYGEHQAWKLLGKPQSWPSPDPPAGGPLETADRVANSQRAEYKPVHLKEGAFTLAALPLELAPNLQAIILLLYRKGTPIYKLELEGRITRWIYRLSLRNLKVANRFTRLMRILRTSVVEARIAAAEHREGNHLQSFVEDFLNRAMATVKAGAAMLTLYSRPETGPSTVERFWICEDHDQKSYSLDQDIFIGSTTESPCSIALKTHQLGFYRPHDPERNRRDAAYLDELIQLAHKLARDGHTARAGRLQRLVDLFCAKSGDSTMLVVPVESPSDPHRQICGALSLIIPGLHDMNQGQQELVIELGILLADSLDQLRDLDASAFERSISEGFEQFRSHIARADTYDDVVGLLLKIVGQKLSMASGDPVDLTQRWSLSSHAVFWLLSPGYHELVARSGRGSGLEVLGEDRILDPRQHPLLAAEINPAEIPRKERPRIGEFRIWTLKLGADQENPLLQRYARLPQCGWLVSFALMQADNRIIGVIDCPREKPLRPEEESVLHLMLRRLSFQVCAAAERCRFEQTIKVAREMTESATAELEGFRAPAAYEILVEKVRDELGGRHCDLFLDRDGAMILHGTTRLNVPIDEKTRHAYQVSPAKGAEVLGDALASKAPRMAHGTPQPVGLDHLSPALQHLMASDHLSERLVIPIGEKSKTSPLEVIPGLLYLCGPMSHQNQGREEREVKKSGLLTQECLRRARNLSVEVYRNAMMARLVERQGWLINELQHAIGQPLQGLRGWCDNLLRTMADHRPITDDDLGQFNSHLNRGFQLVHESRAQLAIYAKMSQPVDKAEFSRVRLNRLIRGCCHFMDPEAGRKGCFVTYSPQAVRHVWGNEAMLRTSVINLIDNAIKYSYKGREISVSLREDGSGCLTLSVENYGVGIPKPDLPRIFEPYFRSKVPDQKGERRGSGIGLAIVKHAVEVVHSGRVEVVSDPPRNIPPGRTAAETAQYPYKTTFIIKLFREALKAV